MEIVFGQVFDQNCSLDYTQTENQRVFNRKFAGPLGLLSYLERELGLSGRYARSVERKISFQKICREFLKENSEVFFGNSFQVDPGGVAEELLKYRDQLVLAGWSKEFPDVSDKIDCLRAIDRFEQVEPGIEDRWQTVYQSLKLIPEGSLKLTQISLNESTEFLHPFFQNLFRILEEKKVIIDPASNNTSYRNEGNLALVQKLIGNEVKSCELSTDDKESFQILHFRSDLEAAEFFATQGELLSTAVILNEDNTNFDFSQEAFGKPASGSTFYQANPQLLQLFKLSAALFIRPLQIHNLLSYMQIPIHPVPSLLRRNLLQIIATEGGIENQKWKDAVENYPYESDKRKTEIQNFLTVREYASKTIDKIELIRFYHSLGDWARKYRAVLDDDDHSLSGQLIQLRDLCTNFINLVENFPTSELSAQELFRALNDSYDSINIINKISQKGSIPVFENAGQVYSPTETLVWLDFYNSGIKPTFYRFLNDLEIRKLSEHGALLWDTLNQAKLVMLHYKNALLKIRKRCILVVCDQAKGEISGEHPLFSTLKAGIKNLDEFIIHFEDLKYLNEFNRFGFETPEIIEIKHKFLPARQAEHQIQKGSLVEKRTTESVSSVEQFIQYPFDWVLQYAAKIQPSGSFELEDITTVKGNVAHYFIEQLLVEARFDLDSANDLLNDYEVRIQKCIDEHGAILLLDENRFEYQRFVKQLQRSTETLISLIKQNQLKVTAIERPVEGSAGILSGQNFFGLIDLLLEDKHGSLVIFDLKWALSEKKYINKLKSGKAIQLSIYKALLQNEASEVSATGYFILSSGKLITEYDFIGENVYKIGVNDTELEIMKKIENSIEYRRKQVSEGILEEGEESLLNELNYFKDTEENNLIELESNSTGKTKKKNYYSSLHVLKGYIS